MRKRRVVGRIYGMKYSRKGHKERNRYKNRIKRSGQARLVYVEDLNRNIPTTWRRACGDVTSCHMHLLDSLHTKSSWPRETGAAVKSPSLKIQKWKPQIHQISSDKLRNRNENSVSRIQRTLQPKLSPVHKIRQTTDISNTFCLHFQPQRKEHIKTQKRILMETHVTHR